MSKVDAKYRVYLKFNGGHEFSLVNVEHSERLRWEEAVENAQPFTISLNSEVDWYLVNPFNLSYIKFKLQENDG